MRLATLLFFSLVISCNPCFSKSDSKLAKDSSAALVEEIVVTVKSAKLTEEEALEQQKARNARVESILSDLEAKGDIPPDVKAKILTRIQSKQPLHEQVQGAAVWKEKLNVGGFVNDTANKVLCDHLDRQDLKNLLKFLKTSTGQKLIKQAPDMLSETTELTVAKFLPPAIEFGKQFAIPRRRGGGPEMSPEQMEKQKEMMDKIKDLLRQQRFSPEPRPDET